MKRQTHTDEIEQNILTMSAKGMSQRDIEDTIRGIYGAEVSAFFEYPEEIRKLIYTANAVEGYHRMVRKFTKTKTILPTDDAIRKVIYLSVVEASKKWTMPVRFDAVLPSWFC